MAYNLGPVKPHVERVANEIGLSFDVEKIYGYANRKIAGTNTLSDHARGLALDFMTYRDLAKGHVIAGFLTDNADRLNVKYIIWNRRIWYPGGWKKYGGVNPHTDHVHVSFNKGTYNEPESGLPQQRNMPGPFDDALRAANDFVSFVTNTGTWYRISIFIAGIALLFFALLMLTKPTKRIINAR